MNILHITPDFNYACGRSYYVYLLLKYLKRSGYNVILATNGGDSLDRVEDLGVKIEIVKGLRSKGPISITRSIKKIRELILAENIGIIHTHHRRAELLALQAKNLSQSRKTASVHTALSMIGKRYIVEFKSDIIIAVSRSVLDMLVNRF